jgi:hypothetical protein
MMRFKSLALGVAGLLALPATASAQSTTATAGPFPVTGNVPALCSGGTLTGGNTSFDLGVLINTATGLLRSDLAAAPKVLTGAFCTSRSRISRSVNYTASAAGWTTNPAQFATASGSNPAASQDRGTAFQGDITVSIGSFSTAGGDTLRLIADPSYQGTVTVTLAVAN